MEVVFIASEVAPIAKVGGLADVVGALPIALSKIGVATRVILPKYGVIDLSSIPHTTPFPNLTVPWNGGRELVHVHEAQLPHSSVPLFLIEHDALLSEDGIYPPSDIVSETTRFAFFNRAVMALLETARWPIDIIHCHDWQSSWIPILLTTSKIKSGGKTPKTLLTIHNLAMQGIASDDEIWRFIMIDPQVALQQNDGKANFLRQGILTADAINTVSPTYAQEILTSEYGAGLETVLAKREKHLAGIVNGIDYERFNPETDPQIRENYSINTIERKEKNKSVLQKLCKLPLDPSLPLIGLVSRLTDQKGIDLTTKLGKRLFKHGLQLIVFGTAYPEIEQSLRELAKQFPHAMHVSITFDAELAQKIYAGADMFLMPSRFEPCGLGQLIAMRYGTVPIVRATGGLKDTVEPISEPGGSGLVFDDFNSRALQKIIDHALALYSNRAKIKTVRRRAMRHDFSWEASAKEYLKLYKHLMK